MCVEEKQKITPLAEDMIIRLAQSVGYDTYVNSEMAVVCVRALAGQADALEQVAALLSAADTRPGRAIAPPG